MCNYVGILCRTTFGPKVASAKRTAVTNKVVCSAEKSGAEKMGKAAAAAALSAVLGLTAVDAAMADVAGLTPCSESKAFAKRKKQEVKGLTKRLNVIC